MAKESWRPGNMVYPLPAVLVTVGDEEKSNIITVAWTGTICSDPAMVYISVRKERFSYNMLKEGGTFVINLTTKEMARATDFCGVRSGRDVDKWQTLGLTKEKSKVVSTPLIKESPVNIECEITEIIPLGSHDMFMAKVVNVNIDTDYLDEDGRFHLELSNPLVYSHGHYYETGKEIGKFGFSVEKKKTRKKRLAMEKAKSEKARKKNTEKAESKKANIKKSTVKKASSNKKRGNTVRESRKIKLNR